jgi:hypothetical protein
MSGTDSAFRRPTTSTIWDLRPYLRSAGGGTTAAAAEVVVMTQLQAPERRELTTESRRRPSPFWRHFLEMVAAMAVGMIVAAAIFAVAVNAASWDEISGKYPTQALLAMAVGMTVPMAGWMLHRGMGRRNTAEMSAVMLLTVVPFLCLVWFDVTSSAQCGGYCLLSLIGMFALMRYRRNEYSRHTA